jgi:hypothetical protein
MKDNQLQMELQRPIPYRLKEATKILNKSQEMIEFTTRLLKKPRRKLNKKLKRKH